MMKFDLLQHKRKETPHIAHNGELCIELVL